MSSLMNQDSSTGKLACIIPAYNEERFIADVISSIPQYIDYIIVVNDCSRDRTAEVVTQLKNDRVILINHATNTGVGGAVISGFKKAIELDVRVAIKLDGDGQMDSGDIRKLIKPLLANQADYAKGVRFRSADVIKKMPLVRLIGNTALSFLTKAASGYWNIFDPTNGFVAIRGSVLKRISFNELGRGYYFETSMLVNLYKLNAVVVDVPMRTRYGAEESHLNPAKILFTFPYYLAKSFLSRILMKYYISDFNAFSAFFLFGLLLFCSGLSFGVFKWVVNYFRGVATPAGTVMLAAMPLLLGFQMLLQAIILDINSVPRKENRLYDGEEDD